MDIAALGLPLGNKALIYRPPVPIESLMLCETYTRTVQPYAYGTEKHTISVWYEIRVRYTTVPLGSDKTAPLINYLPSTYMGPFHLIK